jgi:NADH:ubiquinone oxidoreductase subunit 2 (subunit N)
MDLFTWFDSLLSFNITFFIVSVTILSSLSFGVIFASAEEFDFPNMLNVLLVFSLLLLVLLVTLFGNDFSVAMASSNSYYFSQYFQFLFLVLSFLVILATRDFVTARKITKFEYDTLLLFVVLSALCLCFVDDFLLFYLAIELQSLCFYVFATFNRNSEFSTESGLKYFVFGAVISCLLLLGFSMIYIAFGSTSFEFLMSIAQTSNDTFLFLGFLFILVALLFKVGSAPFHS